MPSSCCVRGCSNKQTFYGYSMFGFPNDPDIKSQWVKAVSTDTWGPNAHHRVCEVHFDPALINFVGSRKELKRNAVPTLFCNCFCLQSNNEVQEKDSSRISGKPTSRFRATILDHSYSQNSSEQSKKNKDCHNLRNSDATGAKKKSLKHAPDCNLAREALKNTQKIKVEADNNDGLKMPLLRPSPVIRLVKIHNLVQNHPKSNLIKKAKNNQGRLKLQLKSALDENAKLKQELNLLKSLVDPPNCRLIKL